MLTTNFQGSFVGPSDGLVAGIAFDDPATRNALSGGIVAAASAQPLWQGLGISEFIPPNNGAVLGPQLSLATAQANLSGFTVYNQSHAGLTSPQSPVPQYAPGQTIGFYRFGSGARITLACKSTLAATLQGGAVQPTGQVSWDYVNQQLVAYDGVAALPIKVIQVSTVNAITIAYNATTGALTYVTSGNAVAVAVL